MTKAQMLNAVTKTENNSNIVEHIADIIERVLNNIKKEKQQQ